MYVRREKNIQKQITPSQTPLKFDAKLEKESAAKGRDQKTENRCGIYIGIYRKWKRTKRCKSLL
jgi:hypothetical protein